MRTTSPNLDCGICHSVNIPAGRRGCGAKAPPTAAGCRGIEGVRVSPACGGLSPMSGSFSSPRCWGFLRLAEVGSGVAHGLPECVHEVDQLRTTDRLGEVAGVQLGVDDGGEGLGVVVVQVGDLVE